MLNQKCNNVTLSQGGVALQNCSYTVQQLIVPSSALAITTLYRNRTTGAKNNGSPIEANQYGHLQQEQCRTTVIFKRPDDLLLMLH